MQKFPGLDQIRQFRYKKHEVQANILHIYKICANIKEMNYSYFLERRDTIIIMGMGIFSVGRRLKNKIKELEAANEHLRMEVKHYRNMDELHEKYDVFIHDMKHMLRTIAALAEDGDCEKIAGLIADTRINIGKTEQRIICSNKVLNALLSERKGYASDNGIDMEIEVREPLYLQGIEETDLIALVGNLLDNAIEAQRYSRKNDEMLYCMKMASEGRHIIIYIENSYDEGHSDGKGNKKINGQIGNKRGIGLKSVQNVVRKLGGIIENEKNDGRYAVKIILPVQSKWEEGKSCSDNSVSYLQLLSK